jgi:hypothetical protein
MQNHLSEARQGTLRPLYIDMRLLGSEHFFIEALETFEAEIWQVAYERETMLIHRKGTLHPQGYNLSAPLSYHGLIPDGPGEWITAREASAYLSEINGRPIPVNLVYQMALDGRIHSRINLKTETKQFWKADLEGRIIRIRTDRPKRTKKGAPAQSPS